MKVWSIRMLSKGGMIVVFVDFNRNGRNVVEKFLFLKEDLWLSKLLCDYFLFCINVVVMYVIMGD